jgi:3-methyladenine DNA glycosylase AlkD
MTLDEVMRELARLGTESTKRTHLRHGAPEPLFGVRIGDMKPLLKKLKGKHEIALDLYATKNSDAMYLAGLLADGAKMTRKQLDQWANTATWHMIAGCTVPWVTSDHPKAIEIAAKWIDSKKELVAVAGWSTLASVASMVPDESLPMEDLSNWLDRCASTIHSSSNRVRYAMNSFVISVGTYVAPLGKQSIAVARKIGKVEVDMGQTDCKIPDAESYILKCRRGSTVAPKRKTCRC